MKVGAAAFSAFTAFAALAVGLNGFASAMGPSTSSLLGQGGGASGMSPGTWRETETDRLATEPKTHPRCPDETRFQRVSQTLRDPAIRPALGFGVYRLGEQDQGNVFSAHTKLELFRGPVWVAYSGRLASAGPPAGSSHEILLGYSFRQIVHDSLCEIRRTDFRLFMGTRTTNLVGVRGRRSFWPLQAGVLLARASTEASAEVYASFLWEPHLAEVGFTVGGAYVFPLLAPFDRPWLYASAELGNLGQLGVFTGIETGLKVEY
jgi:hypothetical protein